MVRFDTLGPNYLGSRGNAHRFTSRDGMRLTVFEHGAAVRIGYRKNELTPENPSQFQNPRVELYSSSGRLTRVAIPLGIMLTGPVSETGLQAVVSAYSFDEPNDNFFGIGAHLVNRTAGETATAAPRIGFRFKLPAVFEMNDLATTPELPSGIMEKTAGSTYFLRLNQNTSAFRAGYDFVPGKDTNLIVSFPELKASIAFYLPFIDGTNSFKTRMEVSMEDNNGHFDLSIMTPRTPVKPGGTSHFLNFSLRAKGYS